MAFVVWNLAGANSYVSVAEADTYFELRLAADNWTAGNTSTKQKALATATALLDLVGWAGTPTVVGQPLGWPRTGVTGVTTTELPAPIKVATFEMALALLANPAMAAMATNNIRDIRAGSVGITFFGQGDSVPLFPRNIMRLIGPYLGSQQHGVGGTEVFNNEDCTAFPTWRDDNLLRQP